LDVDNGILLSPLLDALFDRHLISFTNTGDIIVSSKLSEYNLRSLNLTGEEKIFGLTEGNKMYLEEHRKKLK
jgi:predicted restriction endonuclease